MAADTTPSWYLHPLVAQQKREVHPRWIRRWDSERRPGVLLKTDLFEDAFGDDTLLPKVNGAVQHEAHGGYTKHSKNHDKQ